MRQRVYADPLVRQRLRAQGKPTIIKSLKNGDYYCGVGVTQSRGKYVMSHWRNPLDPFSGLPYARGQTPAEAYALWKRRVRLLNRQF